VRSQDLFLLPQPEELKGSSFSLSKKFPPTKKSSRDLPFLYREINTGLFVIEVPPIRILAFAMSKQFGLLILNPRYAPLLPEPLG
jgi:hypothetical protein